MVKLYISGKITGIDPESCEKKFLEAERRLKKLGYEVYNPFDEIKQARMRRRAVFKTELDDYNKIMALNIYNLLWECDGVALLPDWKDSKGARIEKYVAEEMGLAVKEIKKWN